MKNNEKIEKILVCIPLVFGVVSIILHGIYIWDAYHLRSITGVFCITPITSIAGLLFFMGNRKVKK